MNNFIVRFTIFFCTIYFGINNNHIGYNRDKVIALKNKLRKEYDERKLKQLNKERRNKSKGGFN